MTNLALDKVQTPLTIEELKKHNLILLDCISGSRAYGLDTETSDTDIKGVFYLPKNHYFGLQSEYVPQVSNETNDEVYYELGRFIELLLKNNPTVMELLATPADKIRYKHPLMNELKSEWVISKLCQHTFAGFANSQIKKARGLNKKIVNPMSKEKKSVLDFCLVFVEGKSIAVNHWLKSTLIEDMPIQQRQIGLSAMPRSQQIYAVYYDTHNQHNYAGIIRKTTATQVLLSSIPKGMVPITYLSFNQLGYSKYCNDYTDYWSWVGTRNETRYQSTLTHGKQYDAKNMMHTIRLLQVALDIAVLGEVVVKRDNREELLAIKKGQREYDDLLDYADELSRKIINAFASSSLIDKPNEQFILTALVNIRTALYK